MGKKILLIISLVFFWILCPLRVNAEPIDGRFFDSGEGVLILERNSGDYLYNKDTDHRYYPASTTKLVTALVTCEEVADLNTKVSVGEEIKKLDPESSVANLEIGENLSYLDLLYGLLLPSGNDASMVLAYHIGQKVDPDDPIAGFVGLMNCKVESLGLTNTHFMNPHGLHHSDHYTTPEDLAIIAEESFKSKIILKIIHTPDYTCSGKEGKQHHWYNSNLSLFAEKIPRLFDRLEDYPLENPFYNPLIYGGKTGFTDEAGRCFVFLSKVRDMEVIGILLGVEDKTGIFVQANAITNSVNKSYVLLYWNKVLKRKNIFVANPRSYQDAFFYMETDKDLTTCLTKAEIEKYQLLYLWDEGYCYEKEGKIHLNRSISEGSLIGEGVAYLDNKEIKRFPLISPVKINKRTWVSVLKDIFLKLQIALFLKAS